MSRIGETLIGALYLFGSGVVKTTPEHDHSIVTAPGGEQLLPAAQMA